MKAIRKITVVGTILMGLIFGGAVVQAQPAPEQCDLVFGSCPEDFDGQTIIVPTSVVAIAANVRACNFTGLQQSATPPAVMLVIDHSGSMQEEDRNGSRFRVALDILNEIYRVVPDAQVGVTVFGGALVLDHTWDPNIVPFARAHPADGGGSGLPNQGYMPLLQLNGRASRGGYIAGTGDTTGIAVLRRMFNVSSGANPTGTLRNAANQTVNTLSGTNITIALQSAVEAFSQTTIDRKDQYIIFLSDGVSSLSNLRNCGNAAAADRSPYCDMQFDYVTGANVPTTYTVFLADDRQATPPVPDELQDFTDNVKNNRYSENNPNSDIWSVSSNYQALLTLVMDNVITPMLTQIGGTPTKMVVTNAVVTDSTGNDGENSFNFRRPLGLDVGTQTEVQMSMTYRVEIEEDLPGGGTQKTMVDSIQTFTFTFERRANASVPTGFTLLCKTRPSLSLQYNGTPVTDAVKDHMRNLQIVLDQGGNNYDTVPVLIMNTDGTVLDTVNLNLSRSGNVWTGSFDRIISDLVNREDRILQHAGQDSIIVFFRNPYAPLDTARIAIPFVSMYALFYDSDRSPGTPGAPGSLTPLKDTISVTAGVATTIFTQYFDANDQWLRDFGDDPSKITWTTSGSVTLVESNGKTATFRSTAAGDNINSITATYREPGEHGDMVITKTLYVKVDPIQITLHERNINPGPGNPAIEPSPAIVSFTPPLAAGRDKVIYAKFTDANGNLINDPATLEFLRENMVWSVPTPAGVSPTAGADSTVFRSNVAHRNYMLTAALDFPGRPSVSINISVVPGDATGLDIVRDTTRNDNFLNNKGNLEAITLDENNNHSVKVWVVARDEFGNFVRFVEDPQWSSVGGPKVEYKKDGNSFNIVREAGSGELVVTARSGSLESQDLRVTVVGESSAAVGPNPFAPGKSTLGELGGATYNYYKDIIEVNHGGSIGQGGQNTSGILVVVEAPMPLKPGPNGVTSLKIVIYDAVGNVVLSTNTHRDAKLAESETYGFIWDGKNHRGRAVGPGTYLMRIDGVLWNGQKFRESKKIGIVKAK